MNKLPKERKQRVSLTDGVSVGYQAGFDDARYLAYSWIFIFFGLGILIGTFL